MEGELNPQSIRMETLLDLLYDPLKVCLMIGSGGR
jgi:hypothetical protein